MLSNIKNGDWVLFANATFDKAYKEFTANIAFQGEKGVFEIRTNTPNGKCIGKIKLGLNNLGNHFQEFTTQIKAASGRQDLYLVYRGSKESELQLDWIKFK